jgi:hypothetical protein
VPAAWATGTAGRNGLVHDAADGARAAAALGAAAEAAINLPGRARCIAATERRTHVVIAQHVAGTDDHGELGVPERFSCLCNYRYMSAPRQAKAKRQFFSYSNVRSTEWWASAARTRFCKLQQ